MPQQFGGRLAARDFGCVRLPCPLHYRGRSLEDCEPWCHDRERPQDRRPRAPAAWHSDCSGAASRKWHAKSPANRCPPSLDQDAPVPPTSQCEACPTLQASPTVLTHLTHPAPCSPNTLLSPLWPLTPRAQPLLSPLIPLPPKCGSASDRTLANVSQMGCPSV